VTEPDPDLSALGFDPPAGLPAALQARTRGAAWMPLRLETTQPARYEIRWADGRVAQLWAAPPGPAGALVTATLVDERDRLDWFAGRAPVGEVLEWATNDDGAAFLLTVPPPGSPAVGAEHGGDAAALITTLAEGLRAFHALPVEGCPFPMGIDERIARARARVAAGLVVQEQLAVAYRRYAPSRLLELLVESRPDAVEDLVVVHGAPTLDNLHLDGGRVVGHVELARAGVADRYVDLAITAADLAHRVSPEALGPFFDAYGIELPDVRKIDFYVLLDELS
jgi:aminoglycoside phosphotransferase